MTLYFASPASEDFYLLRLLGVKSKLFSYYYLAKQNPQRVKKYLSTENCFIDSGAFSAKNLGVDICLESYMKFLSDYNSKIYAGLDVIGDGSNTYKNTKIMMENGFSPIHTFHKGEEISWLYKTLELPLPYIAIGGMVGIQTNKNQMIEWLNKVWKVIIERRPDIKVHGFACTSYDIMRRYPWYSVDSTTWNVARKFGEGFDEKGNRKKGHKIITELNNIKYLRQMSDGNKLILSTVYTMLEWEKLITMKHSTMDFNYLTRQLELF